MIIVSNVVGFGGDCNALIKQTKLLKPILGIAIGAFLWAVWPLYGFVSNQFEIMRLPWGWQGLPTQIPENSIVFDESYAVAGKAALEILAERRADIASPSISAAIAIEGHLVWAGAVGWANVKDKEPATPQTIYRIGSTSKSVSMTGLARLVDAGKVELDTPISTYFSDSQNEAWNDLTARQLASHTAGLAAYEENNDWIGFYHSLALRKRFSDMESSLNVFDGADMLSEPGTDFHYSGFDNVLLSALMAEAVGKSFNEFMQVQVFSPLGLNKTGPDHLRREGLDYAVSYQSKNNKVKPWRTVDLSHKLAAGGYVSTPSELAKLGAAWMDETFLTRQVTDVFWTPMKLKNGRVNEQDYALGFRRKSWKIDGVGDVEHLNHGGVSKGAQCWLMIEPEYNLTLAISINRRTDAFFDFADVYVDLLEIFIPQSEVFKELQTIE